MKTTKRPDTGVTAAAGFSAAGVHCGIRAQRADLAIIASDRLASAAAVFTRNRVVAAPVVASRQALARSGGMARTVLVNSGNANACTGQAGDQAAQRSVQSLARLLEIAPEHVLVASTGVIGERLPIDRLLAGLPRAVATLSIRGGAAAAEAILTTDTCTKQAVRRVETPAGEYVVGGMAKGSGMIHPDLATTLAFVTTDAALASVRLQELLRRTVERSFNRITVDGETSTNDMVAVLANGASGVRVDGDGGHLMPQFEEALGEVLLELAQAVVRDGEGATKLITVRVSGARSEQEAARVAHTIAGSPLVKTAIHGADANWGRIVAAAGRAGVAVEAERMAIRLNGLQVLEPGLVSDFSDAECSRLLGGEEVLVEVELGLAEAEATVWTCDLSKGYIDINASYRS